MNDSTKLSSHYKDYLKEEEGQEVIEIGSGFVTYEIDGEECFIGSIYVEPEARGGKQSLKLLRLVGEAAAAKGCKFISANTFHTGEMEKVTRKVQLMVEAGFLVKSITEKNITWGLVLQGGK